MTLSKLSKMTLSKWNGYSRTSLMTRTMLIAPGWPWHASRALAYVESSFPIAGPSG
jgi:hypothetical protein